MGTASFEVVQGGDAPVVRARLEDGSSIFADSGAMMAMTPNLTLESSIKGGIMGALSRQFLRGETFFYLTIKARGGDGEVLLAPATVGGIEILELTGTEYFLQKGSFLAATDLVQLSTKSQNLTQGLFSGEGFFITRVGGRGTLVLNTFGALMKFTLAPGQEYIIDNYHLVAWEATTSYQVTRAAAGWISSFTSGEGFVCRFKGPGTVYSQSRNPKSFAGWLRKYMPAKG